MAIKCVQIQWRRAFVLSAAVALAACSSSSTTNDAGRTLGGSGGTISPSSGGNTVRLDAAVASTGGATVSSGGSTTSSSTGVDATPSDRPATGGTGGGSSAADGAAGQSGGDAPAVGGTQTDAAIADGQGDLRADVGTLGDRGTDSDRSGGGDAGTTNDSRPPEATDAHLLADVSGSVDVTSPVSIDAGSSVFVRPADGTGVVFLSSWAEPNGSDSDEYVYDDFTPAVDGNIFHVLWHGAYVHNQLYTTAVSHFTIAFYESIAGGAQPNITNPQLPETYLAFYDTNGNAGEAVAASFSGVTMYDYQYDLPTPFHVVAGTKYWIRIEASQNGIPDWGIARGTGGDGTHFMFFTGLARFATAPGDVAFTLR
jgi:hypothetical protein